MLLKKINLYLLLFMPVLSLAGQKISIKPNEEGLVQISQASLNRIYLDGDKINQVISLVGELIIQKDLEAGQLFLKPVDELREKTIEIFLSTEKGYQFSLSLQPLAIKAQNIEVQVKENTRSVSDENRIIALIREMNQYHYSGDISSDILASKNAKQQFYAESLLGESLNITNNTKKAFIVNVQQYWQQGVLAVGVKKEILKPGESTQIYVVKKYG